MNLDRRQLALPVLAMGLLGVVPAFAGADEDAVAKSVEAFRAAQFAADAKALDGLCAAELSYSHSDARIEDKATFIANATNGKSKFLSLEYQDVSIRVVGPAAIVRFLNDPLAFVIARKLAASNVNASTCSAPKNSTGKVRTWAIAARVSTVGSLCPPSYARTARADTWLPVLTATLLLRASCVIARRSRARMRRLGVNLATPLLVFIAVA